MTRQPTNSQLAKKIDGVEKKVEERLTHMDSAIGSLKVEVNEKLQPFHDYLVGIKAIEHNKSNTNTQMMNNIIKIMLIMAAVIAFLLNIDIGAVLGA